MAAPEAVPYDPSGNQAMATYSTLLKVEPLLPLCHGYTLWTHSQCREDKEAFSPGQDFPVNYLLLVHVWLAGVKVLLMKYAEADDVFLLFSKWCGDVCLFFSLF